MKNKDRYNLKHFDIEIDYGGSFAIQPSNRITLRYENKPIITFNSTIEPFKAVLGWLEEDLEDY